MIFIDTPGIHRPRTKLGSYMTDAAIGTLKEVDAIIFIVDDKLSDGPGDKYIVDLLDDVVTPKILVINKIDKMQPDEFAEIYKEYEELGLFEEIIGVSAKEGTQRRKRDQRSGAIHGRRSDVLPGRYDHRTSGTVCGQ